MVVETHLDPSMEIYQYTPRGYRANTRAGGVIPHQITFVSPNGPNNSTIVMFETIVITSNTFDES